MFDQLHDPDPPEATSRHLALVAERAAHLRRRRNTIAGGVAAVGLLAAGTIGVAAASRSGADEAPIAAGELPPVDTVAPTTSEPDVAPTTTVLDPESLPPAIPVNTDPSDDPDPTVTDPGDEPSGDGGSGGEETVPDRPSESDPEDAEGDPGTPPNDAVLDVATAAAMRANDPLVAIDVDGDAVWFPDDVPVVVASSATRLDFLSDGTATVEGDDGALSTVSPDGTIGSDLPNLASHEVGPDGVTVCGIRSGGTELACGDGDSTTSFLDAFGAGTGVDVTWLDADTVLALGRSDAWTITIAELSTGEATHRSFALLDGFDDLRFAGRDRAGEIAVHDAGTDLVLAGTLDRYGAWQPDDAPSRGTALRVVELDAPARSVWYDGATQIVVAVDGALTVDGVEYPGTYRSARR